jgi:8-oxo-dGTP pyrophosphatase MutT (NUDIX family)
LALYAPREVAAEERPRAAVLVPLYYSHDELHVLFTKRSDLVEHHKGEIAFPGGGYEAVDVHLVATALREAEEEIGLRPADVRVLGRLDDIVTTSAFHVSVYVGEVITAVPYAWCYQEDEVACLLEVPLAHLLDGSNLVEFELERRGEVVLRQGYRFGEHIIWGATGQMLRNFLEVALERPLTVADD